jgi:hypothetical protein
VPPPPGLDRVEDLPGQLDLLMTGEQGWFAQQDIKDESLISLGELSVKALP